MLCGSPKPFRELALRSPDENSSVLVFAPILKPPCDLPFRFEWVLDQNQHLSEFKFGYDPVEADD